MCRQRRHVAAFVGKRYVGIIYRRSSSSKEQQIKRDNEFESELGRVGIKWFAFCCPGMEGI